MLSKNFGHKVQANFHNYKYYTETYLIGRSLSCYRGFKVLYNSVCEIQKGISHTEFFSVKI